MDMILTVEKSHVFVRRATLEFVATKNVRFKSSKLSGNTEVMEHNYNFTIWADIDKVMSAFFLIKFQFNFH